MMLLRIGSSGQDVKLLQEFLGITADGIFGTLTQSAVVTWQSQNGLKADGIVGSKTIAAMGFLTTDCSEHTGSEYIGVENFLFDKWYLSTGNYFEGPVRKRWIFLHHTAGWHNPYDVVHGWNSGIATEFIIGGQSIRNTDDSYDGVVVQAMPPEAYAWHLGIGNTAMHRESVGIELCNFGWIHNGKTYVGTDAHPLQIVKLTKSFRGYTNYHKYSDKQLEQLKNVLTYIGNRDNIDIRKGLPELIRDKGIKAFDTFDLQGCINTPGIWSHTNVRRDKTDVFPQGELMDMLLSL
jgi:hypothetical protein